MGILSRILARIASLSATHPKIVLGIAVIVSLISLWGISRLSIDLRASSLLPENLPSLEEYRRQVSEFGRTEFLIVMVKPPEGVPFEKYRRFIADYKKALYTLSLAKREYLNLTEELLENIGDYILRHGVYLVDPSQLKQLNAILSVESMKDKFQRFQQKSSEDHFDPFGLITLAEKYFLPSKNIRPDRSGEFYVTRDFKFAFFVFGSTAPAGKTEQTKELLQSAKTIQEGIWKRYEGLYRDNFAETIPPPEVVWTGLPLILLEDLQTLQRTSVGSILLSFAGVTLLFLLFFRGLRPFFLAGIPLILGVLSSFGFAGFALRSLNIATAGIGAILIGLGIDFPAYLLNAFYRRYSKGDNFLIALQGSWHDSGRSVCFGALSTSAAFFMFLTTRLEAFRELGLIAGMGLLLTLTAVIFLLPALLALWKPDPQTVMVRPIPSILLKLSFKKARTVAVICLIIFVSFTCFSTRLQLNMDFKETHAEGTQASRSLNRLGEVLDNSLQPLMLIVSGRDWEEALVRNEKLADLLRRYERAGKIRHTDSLSRWLPSQKRQQETRARLKETQNLSPDHFDRNYDASLESIHVELQGNYKAYKKNILTALKARRRPDYNSFQSEGLGVLLDRYSREGEYRVRLINYIYLTRGLDNSRHRNQLLKELAKEEPFREGWASYVAEERILNEMEERIRADLWRVGVAIFLIMAVILWFSFRSFSLVFLSMVPMILGMGAMLGCYALLKEYLSGVNLLFIPLYVGLAIDDAIHLIHSRRQENGSIQQALVKTGMPILFTSLTTIVGFGSLALGPFPIMQQAGLLIVLAMACELLGSLLFLPALFVLKRSKTS